MPFSKSKGDRLAVIGKKLAWIDSDTCPNLPLGWNILYQLALLDRAILERLIATGVVNPNLTLREAKELVADLRGQPRTGKSRQINIKRRVENFEHFVFDSLSHWSPEDEAWVRSRLLKLAGILGAQEMDCQQESDFTV